MKQSLTGMIFDDWQVLSHVYDQRRQKYLCRCICGEERIVLAQNLLNRRSKSCGCSPPATFPFLPRRCTLCKCSTQARNCWFLMLTRCYDTKYEAYPRYGGAGIIVVERWFYLQNFVDDMGEPQKGMTLDRISSFGNYEPQNCRWATRREQNRNKRFHHYLEYNGQRKLLVDWARELGISHVTLYSRLHDGWTDEEIICTPINATKSMASRSRWRLYGTAR